MYFHEIWNLLKTGKFKAKRKDWKGYWTYGNNTIWMHCSDGRVLDIRETEDVEFTYNNIAASDWVCESIALDKYRKLDELRKELNDLEKELADVMAKYNASFSRDYDCKEEIFKCCCDLKGNV